MQMKDVPIGSVIHKVITLVDKLVAADFIVIEPISINRSIKNVININAGYTLAYIHPREGVILLGPISYPNKSK